MATVVGEAGEQSRALRAFDHLYTRALAISERALGPDDPDVATSLNNLAALYRAQGRYADAEPLYKRALAIDEKALGPDHPNTKTIRDNLRSVHILAPAPISNQPLVVGPRARDGRAFA
jgi:tetratricopeptide (TPR) repeat protein